MSGAELRPQLTVSHSRPFTPLYVTVPRDPHGQGHMLAAVHSDARSLTRLKRLSTHAQKAIPSRNQVPWPKGSRNCGPPLPRSSPGTQGQEGGICDIQKEGDENWSP